MKLERAALILLGAVTFACIARDLSDAGHQKPTPDAAPRTDAMIAALQDSGWVVMTAEKMGELEWKIADLNADTAALHQRIAQLAREVAVAGGQVRAVTEMYAQAETALRLSGEVHGDTLHRLERAPEYANPPGARPDSVTWEYSDSTFGFHARYIPPASLAVHSMSARFGVVLAWSEAPDGRILASLIPSDRRVQLSVSNAYWSPPPPVHVCTFGQQARAGAVGMLVGGVGALLLR